MELPKLSPKSYICNKCDEGFITPQHCGRPMDLKSENDNKVWLCWKGEHDPCCGRPAITDYEPCCEEPDLKANVDVSNDQVIL